MPSPVLRVQELIKHRGRLNDQILQMGDFRPGSLVKNYRRCGKPTCHCANEGDIGHGPHWLLTRGVAGKTVTRIIPPAAVEETRRQIAEYHRFRELVRKLVETNDQLCDTQLRAPVGISPAEAKKGASKKRSTPKSSPRSKPS
jgi:hypothetical protein